MRSPAETVNETFRNNVVAPKVFAIACALMMGGNADGLSRLICFEDISRATSESHSVDHSPKLRPAVDFRDEKEDVCFAPT
jgi:hypothetical protein